MPPALGGQNLLGQRSVVGSEGKAPAASLIKVFRCAGRPDCPLQHVQPGIPKRAADDVIQIGVAVNEPQCKGGILAGQVSCKAKRDVLEQGIGPAIFR